MSEDEELEPSLDALSQAFAEAMGHSPSASTEEVQEAAEEQPEKESEETKQKSVARINADHLNACPISPKSILEAILFVGHPDNEPIPAKRIAGLLRGVDLEELEELVEVLNEEYELQEMPFAISAAGEGYQMGLRPEFEHVQDRFYGRVRHAKLSQLAVDVLSVVAYNQPVSREEVDALLNHTQPTHRILNQLVRRDLVARRNAEDQPKRKEYVTTDRFLDLFQLSELSDLPRSEDPS